MLEKSAQRARPLEAALHMGPRLHQLLLEAATEQTMDQQLLEPVELSKQHSHRGWALEGLAALEMLEHD